MKTYQITKEQILDLYKTGTDVTAHKLKRDFPEAFTPDLEYGKWYKTDNNIGNLVFYKNDLSCGSYGFGYAHKNYIENMTFSKEQHWILATEAEIKTALTAEAEKRGFKEGVTVDKTNMNYDDEQKVWQLKGSRWDYCNINNTLELGSDFVFYKGIWAEILPQEVELTLQEIAYKFGIDVNHLKIKK